MLSFLVFLCATPTLAIMVRHDRVQYRDQMMRVMRHSPLKQIKYSCFLYDQILEQFKSAKYLRITIGVNMFQTYQLYKATQTLGFLHRNLALVSRETKDMAYKTLVRPKLECASPVWNPYSKSHVNQLEKVQRIAQ